MDRTQLIAEIVEDMASMRRVAWGHGGTKPLKRKLTHAQMGIVCMLTHAGPQYLKDLAARLQMTPSAATQLVNGLERNHLVTRSSDPNDRRKIRLALTSLGKRMMARAHQERMKSFTALLAPLTDAELRQWSALQRKIIAQKSSSHV